MALLLPDVQKRFCVLPEARVMGGIPPRDTRGSAVERALGFGGVTVAFSLLRNHPLLWGRGQRGGEGELGERGGVQGWRGGKV